MSEPLTDLERAVLDYVIDYQRHHTYPPSVREIGAGLSIPSTRAVSQLIGSLAEKGRLERSPGRSRGLRVLGLRGAAGFGHDTVAEFEPEEVDDAVWMSHALDQARSAEAMEEVPVGAVVVRDGSIIAESGNLTNTMSDPTAHAELLAIRKAATRAGGGRLLDATLYVTLEPCAMCAGAIVLSKVARLVYAAADPKTGMCGSLGCIVQDRRLNHHVRLTSGVLAAEAGDLLRSFFRARRPGRA